MDFNEYQKLAATTDVGTAAQDNIKPGWLYYILGIGGETGELIETVKKHFRDDYGKMTTERMDSIISEAGDIMWYLARLCSMFNIEFEEVFVTNCLKLAERKKKNMIHGDGDNREKE